LNPRRIVIAEDDGALRMLLRTALELDGRFEVVGEAADGIVALQLVDARDPELLLLDLSMPDMDGLEVLDGLRGRSRPTVVVLTGFEDPALGERVLAAGAAAYLTKGTALDDLADRLMSV
jgi:DNA-binding NarL/FixJ family response regulator